MRFLLLLCIARATVKHAGRFLLHLVPGGEVLADIAADAWEDYRRDQQVGGLRAEVQGLAQAPAEVVRREVEAAVKAEAGSQPTPVREALAAYLTQVPAAIRRSLRRPADPTGTTVPATLSLSRPEDLAQLLPTRPPRFRPGQQPLPGVDWVLEELIGVGGFGEVWKARHAHLASKAPVALKFCLDAASAPVLRNEAGVLDHVMRHGRHPGIVPLQQTYLSADPPCLEYEYVAGGDLAGLIRELHARKSPTLDTANRLFQRLVEAVAFAHRADPPIVHGDLKPANVLVRRKASGKVALCVTDFGIGGLAAVQAVREGARRGRQELLTEAVRGAYTPLYASPEQMARRPDQPADPRDDVHALGVIWYQLVTGDLGMMRIPPDWQQHVRECGLDEKLVQLLGSCLASRAGERPATAAVLLERLQTALKPRPRRARWVALGVAAALLLPVGLWVTLGLPSGSPTPVVVPPVQERSATDELLGVATNVRCTSDGPRVVLWTTGTQEQKNRFVQVFDLITGKPISAPFAQGDVPLYYVSFSPDGQRVVTATYASKAVARVWDIQTGQPVSPPVEHSSWMHCPAFSPDGKKVALTGDDGIVRVWEAESGRELFTVQHAKTAMVASFSRDGRHLVTASHDRTARVWNATTGQPITPPLQHEGEVRYAAFSPDGQRVVTASFDRTARVWDAATGQALGTPMKHEAQLHYATFSPDGRRIATASWDKTARVWDAATGQPVSPPLTHLAPLWHVAFSPDSRRVITAGGSDKTARVWDATTGEPVTAPLPHDGEVSGVCFLPDGRRVLTSTLAGKTRLWEVAGGAELKCVTLSAE